jgi:SAM-dependent methyltransferase
VADDVGLTDKLRFIAESLEWRRLRARLGSCPLCGPSLIVRLQRDQLGTRCVRCGASPIAMAIVQVVRERCPDLAVSRVYEASSRGPLFGFLQRAAGELVFSELFEDVVPGEQRAGVDCQDLQSLTYPDDAFDLCTSTEVFEHVPDDARAFAELHRVLTPGGQLILTVPLSSCATTVERAVRDADGVRHLEPPSYHDDLIRGRGGVLVYRDYGRDVVERMSAAGFAEAQIVDPGDVSGMGHYTPVIVGRKPA